MWVCFLLYDFKFNKMNLRNLSIVCILFYQYPLSKLTDNLVGKKTLSNDKNYFLMFIL